MGATQQNETTTENATLELRPNAQAPLHLLPVRRVELGLHRMVDLTLPPGVIVHRYSA